MQSKFNFFYINHKSHNYLPHPCKYIEGRHSNVRPGFFGAVAFFEPNMTVVIKYLSQKVDFVNKMSSANLGPPQVKCRLLISSIFYVMNFPHFLEMLEL